VYIVSERPVEIPVDDEYIRRRIEEGLADVEAGRVAPWDVETFLTEAHRRNAELDQ
jgi:hypothetical protein